MDTMSAYVRGQAAKSSGAKMMVFDWDKAAALIKERRPEEARAGLRDDWEYTGDAIYADAEPLHGGYTYLASLWATPELEMDGVVLPCWRYEEESPGWDAHTKWPESALTILNA